MSHTVAILLFSRTAGEEALHKPFSDRGHAVNEHIARQFISHAEKTARQTGLPVVHVSSAEQRGHTFGERIVNAFRLVFAKGYSKVLAIGNDCPYLTPRLLEEAACRLQQAEVVTGPTRDGGAYLIGVSESSFREDAFRQLSWQTPDFYQSLLGYCRSHSLAYAELSPSTDLDTSRDLARFLRRRHRTEPLRKLAQLIRHLLEKGKKTVVTAPSAAFRRFAGTLHSRRGPPVAA